jgi:hypothetical protein
MVIAHPFPDCALRYRKAGWPMKCHAAIEYDEVMFVDPAFVDITAFGLIALITAACK